MHKAFDIKSAKFLINVIANNKENKYKRIHVSCFKRKLSLNVKEEGADFGYLNVSGHDKLFFKYFLLESMIFTFKQ